MAENVCDSVTGVPTLSPEISDLFCWVNSSVCNCVVHKAEQDQDSTVSIHLGNDLLARIWKDGRLFQWLLHSFKPDLICCPSTKPAIDEIDYEKIQLTFKIAQEEFGVQNLLLRDDFMRLDENTHEPDALILLTYLAQLKYALQHAEPACPNSLQVNLDWGFIMENNSLHMRHLSDAPRCDECQKEVLILERLLLVPANKVGKDNMLRHRQCFCCERCKKLLRIGLYRSTTSGTGYECLDHEKEDLIKRSTASSMVPPVDVKIEEASGETPRIYPDFPKEKTQLYPRLSTPEDKSHDVSTDSGVASSLPDVTSTTTPIENPNEEHLAAPPVPSRSRSSDRDIPVPAPRKHVRGGSDTTAADDNLRRSTASGISIPSPVHEPAKSSKPTLPPKPTTAPAVQLRQHYPEDLNPFADMDSPAYRHSVPAPVIERPKNEARNSVAPFASVQKSSSPKPPERSVKVADVDYDDTLNPFGSDTESETEAKGAEDDDTSSLSSTNPFNESDYENDTKSTETSKTTDSRSKKIPPPRPPPPSSKSVSPPVASSKGPKKRQAPPPPPSSDHSEISKTNPPSRPVSPPKKHGKKKRPAPPRPLPLKRQVRTESTLLPEELVAAFDENDKSLCIVETESHNYECDLRQKITPNGLVKFTDEAIRGWIELVHRKFELVRKETELVYIYRERQLDELHAEIEYQLRCIIEKPESEKTSEDMDREASLLQRMLDVIEEKSKLADSQDELIAQRGCSLPRNSIQLDESSLSAGSASKNSTLEKGIHATTTDDKQAKKKKKIKLRLKKLKQKIANSSFLHA